MYVLSVQIFSFLCWSVNYLDAVDETDSGMQIPYKPYLNKKNDSNQKNLI